MEDKTQNANVITDKAFAEEYEKLCKKLGYRIIAIPVFKATNHNTFEIEIEYRVVAINPT